MRDSKKVRGHFKSLWMPGNGSIIPTTVTRQRKSFAKAKEAEKKAKVLKEIEALTGSPASSYARSYDGVFRRFNGIKGHGSGSGD
jgi:hypothetical protein